MGEKGATIVCKFGPSILMDPNHKKDQEQGASSLDQKGKCHFLSCRLEFECTNNTVEYEALVQGLKKAIDMDFKELKFFGDSEIIIRQVRNTIHCNSPHLKNYQQKVHQANRTF
jgi:ribonuclease HI